MKTLVAASYQPDTKLLDRLNRAEPFVLAAAGLIAAVVLGGWLVPAVGAVLPLGWSLMKANTALAMLLCAAGLMLTRNGRSGGRTLAGRVCASGAVLLATAAMFEHWSGQSTGLSTLLAADRASPARGLMSMQSAFGLLLLVISIMVESTRQGSPGRVLDFLIAALILLISVLIAGYIYHAFDLVGQSSAIRTSPQTLSGLALLTFTQLVRRAPHGSFAALVSMGIGGHVARILVLPSIVFTYLIIYSGTVLLESGYFAMPSVAALSACCIVAIQVFWILLLAKKINALESDLRDRSLCDELTGLHNFRGFHLLGEQLLRDARRNKVSASVLFFDADGLKGINDKLGHEVGSEFLCDIASLLRETFRSNDIVGRIGGDEFAVMARGSQEELEPPLRRFRDAIEATNRSGGKPYQIGCSVGGATAEPQNEESLADLLARADARMYENKRRRRAQQHRGDIEQPLQPMPIYGAAGLKR